jgi:hydroxypyruvate reductase
MIDKILGAGPQGDGLFFQEHRLSKPEVLVAAKVWPRYMQMLDAEFKVHDRLHDADPSAFALAAPRIRGIAASGEARVTRELMAALPALEVISVFGVGYDGVDVMAARERGIPVTNTPGVLTDEVADLALALMLSVARRVPQADRFVRAGLWPSGPFPLTRKVSGARLGIVGLGRIGLAIARRGEALGMSIAYTSRSAKAGVPHRYFPTAQALAAEVDFLVAITPGGAATRKLIDAQVLRALGPNGYFINVARGSVADEAALVEALQNGWIAGAGLDVYENEPHVPAALLALDNVVLTPHMASGTVQTRQAMADLALANLKAHFAGQPVLTLVPELA